MKSGLFSVLRSLSSVLCLAALVLVACLGCKGILTQDAQSAATAVPDEAPPQHGGKSPQTAVRTQWPAVNSQPTVTSDDGPRAAPQSTNLADRHLIQAAALLDKGNDSEAAVHLEKYVTLRPEQLLVRAQLGELLFRLHKLTDARLQFELFIALAQEQGERTFSYLVHSHSRMVEIAEERSDGYEEHLHRGIGLYLLACRRATEPDPNGDYSVTSILCRAAGELQEARKEQPDQARPHLYLYQVWSRLGESTAAARSLAAADEHALLSHLTPHERRQLQIAYLREKQSIPGTRTQR